MLVVWRQQCWTPKETATYSDRFFSFYFLGIISLFYLGDLISFYPCISPINIVITERFGHGVPEASIKLMYVQIETALS